MFIKYENGIYNLEKVESIYTENLKIILYYVDGKGIVDMIRDKDNKISNITYNVNESQNTEIKLR